MAIDTKGYKKLDLSKINFEDKPISMEEALKDKTPMHVPKEVVDGTKEILITKEGVKYM